MSWTRSALALLFLLGGISLPVLACSCMSVGPACSEALRPEVSAVFRGAVLSKRPVVSPVTSFGQTVVVDFSVKELFKGLIGRTAEVYTASSEAACGFPFQVGQEYVVYAYEHGGRLSTSICSRTNLARHRTEDLEYLRRMARLGPTAEVYGEYKKYTFDPNFVPKFTPSLMDHYRPPEDHYRAMAPMTGETITLKSASGQVLTTKVDAEGRFRFVGLPTGEYSISASVPAKLSPPIGMPQGRIGSVDAFQVQAGGCAEFVFRTQPDGRISGRVVDASGRGLPGVMVHLWKAGEHHNKKYGEIWEYAEDDGSFVLGPFPPGEYVVGVHLRKLPQGYPSESRDQEQLRSATLRYFDGATDSRKARTIVLNFGDHRENLQIVIPFDPSAWKNVKVNPN